MAAKTKKQKDLEAAEQLRAVLELVPNPRKILALDLSLNGPGFAVGYADGQQQTESMSLAKVKDLNEKLKLIASKVLHLAKGGEIAADVIIVEQPFVTTDNGSKVLLVHGAMRALLALGGWHGPIIEIHPGRVKSFALGGEDHRGEGKGPFVAVARERFGLLSYQPDEADAAIILHAMWALLGLPKAEIPPACMATITSMLTGQDTAAIRRKTMKAAA